jgi:hypothetical protein
MEAYGNLRVFMITQILRNNMKRGIYFVILKHYLQVHGFVMGILMKSWTCQKNLIFVVDEYAKGSFQECVE